ncbi:cullin-4B [Microthyrium microscopicum]|uniref:Cullin-4B n=1 Tax=Microthyrium microscopicum TaxID=703497 RepID=A0A6A6UJ59_9PEZI|nr:cullin-4B [Microthyrium microscopicum]
MPKNADTASSSNGDVLPTKKRDLPKNPTSNQNISKQLSSKASEGASRTASSHEHYHPDPKRRKLDSTLEPAKVAPTTPCKMYAKRQPEIVKRQPEIVDLTSSQSSSPPPLRISRPAVISSPVKIDTKVLTVRNFRKAKSSPQDYYNATVKKLERALDIILQGQTLGFSNEDLYKGVENICKQGRAADLCRCLTTRLSDHATTTMKNVLSRKVDVDTPSPQALKSILEEFYIWKKRTDFVRDIFYFLERTYLLSQSKNLADMCKEIFRDVVLDDKLLGEKALAGVCDLIHGSRTRTGAAYEAGTCKAGVKMFADLGLYNTKLEPRLLAESQKFFHEWSVEKSKSEALSTYVNSVMALFQLEDKRASDLNLTSFTKRSLSESLELLAIERQVDRLVSEKEVHELLDENDKVNLERLYTLLGRCKQSNEIIGPFEKWIRDRGTEIVFDEEHDDQMVIKLLALKRQIDFMYIESFHRNREYLAKLREAFEEFMNKTKKSKANHGTDNTKQGEMIAKYVNMLLEGGSKAIPSSLKATQTAAVAEEDDNEVHDEDGVINEQLDQVLDLFRFLHGKAVFEAFYKRDLARRLLLGRSASADAELSMINRLRTECGSGFTQNLETMFNDMELSREELIEYKARQTEAGYKSPIDLTVHVLSSAAWPSYPDINFNVPVEVQKVIAKFETSYNAHHNNRKLHWKYALHHTSIVARFPAGPKELIVSAFQAAVLLMFNNVSGEEELSYEMIKATTGLPDEDLKLTLQSLACAKLRPLRKRPEGRDIGTSDVFFINTKFKSPKYRVKINRIQQKETKKENKETHERVALDREFETQAAIVRIMKSKKEYAHNLLIADVITATQKRGKLSLPDIKKQIDRLIEKDYMCRLEEEDPSKKNIYGYVA